MYVVRECVQAQYSYRFAIIMSLKRIFSSALWDWEDDDRRRSDRNFSMYCSWNTKNGVKIPSLYVDFLMLQWHFNIWFEGINCMYGMYKMCLRLPLSISRRNVRIQKNGSSGTIIFYVLNLSNLYYLQFLYKTKVFFLYKQTHKHICIVYYFWAFWKRWLHHFVLAQ